MLVFLMEALIRRFLCELKYSASEFLSRQVKLLDVFLVEWGV